MRVWPHQNDTGGFFVAVLEKKTGSSGVSRAAPEWLPDEREAEWLRLLSARFGIPAAAYEPFRLLRASKKYVSVVSRDHRPGAEPPAVSTGMPLIRAQLEYPKLTTAGAMLLGSAATRNVVEVNENQAAAYMARDEFLLDEEQAVDVIDTGYVLIRREEASLGIALCYRDERRVLSMYPKVLSRAVSG